MDDNSIFSPEAVEHYITNLIEAAVELKDIYENPDSTGGSAEHCEAACMARQCIDDLVDAIEHVRSERRKLYAKLGVSELA
jgi:hypothetical protein